MDRRTVLASVAAAGLAGLAGCQQLGGDPAQGTEATPSSTDPGTDQGSTPGDGDEPPEPDGRTSVIDLEHVSRTYALRPTSFRTDDEARVALWFDRTGTAEHPPRVTGWLENGNDFENTFQVQWIPGVGQTGSRQPRGADHEARLHLAPTANNEIATAVPDVEQTDEGHWHVGDVGPWMPDHHRLGPGERVSLEYVLVGEPGLSGRPTGTYQFSGRGDDEVTVAVWDTDSPGPTGSSHFEGRSVPALTDQRTVQWFHEADETTAAYVEPGSEQIELDGRIDFEMVNHSREATGCGHWDLHKLVDGRWHHVGPVVHTDDCRQLEPGGRVEWSLRAFNGEPVAGDDGTLGRGGFTRGYLGGGEYAAVAGYGHPADESAALVELVGDPAAVVPTEDASAERDGDTVTVTTASHGDGDHPPDATLVLSRLDDGDEPDERVLPEQVMATTGFTDYMVGLRNALAHADADVRRVVVRADEHAVEEATGRDRQNRRFRFRDDAFVVTRADAD